MHENANHLACDGQACRSRTCVIPFLCTVAVLLLATPAGAATNGLIAFQSTGPAPTINTIDVVPPMLDPATGVMSPLKPGTRGTLAGLPRDSANPAWSADGTMLAFSSTEGGVANVYILKADGKSMPRRITNDPVAAIDPTWSPDDRSIAFTSLRGGNPDIYVTRVDPGDLAGAPAQPLTTDPGADQQADWSTAGIAFESDRAGTSDIWLVTPGGRERRLTSSPQSEADAAWSPNAKQIAFSSGLPGTALRAIYTIDLAAPAEPPKALTPRPSFEASFPAWSPDGELIAYSQAGRLVVMESVASGPSRTRSRWPTTRRIRCGHGSRCPSPRSRARS